MVSARWFLASLLFIACSAHAEYRAGHSLSWDEYSKLREAFVKEWIEGKSIAGLHRWNAAMDRELLPAIHEVLTRPDRVFFGTFSDPEERKTGDYARCNIDEGSGLRAIFQKEVSPAKGEGTRLVSVIVFVDYNFRTKELEWVDGPDALRARSEIAPFKPGKHGSGFVGMSYTVRFDKRGVARDFAPGVYLHANGDYRYHNIGIPAGPEHCIVCHNQERTEFSREYMATPVTETEGFKNFMGYLKEHGATADEMARVRKELLKPTEHVVPRGLLAILEKRLKGNR